MSRSPAPKSHRNGLKWRDGRPRWEPSPASRDAGLSGMNLRWPDGRWMDRGEAIALADIRHDWAGLIREAAAGDTDARAALVAVLDALPTPKDATERARRALYEDLVAAARRQLGAPEVILAAVGGGRTVNALIDGYFADTDLQAGDFARAAGTLRVYRVHAKRIRARFGHRAADGGVTRGELRAWYIEIVREVSIETANGVLGAFGAFFKWGLQKDWLSENPATQLGRLKADGRRVFWTPEQERAFIPFCDAHGYPDVADASVTGLWTGASQVDMCAADLDDLAGAVWRYSRVKTGQEALPALLPVVAARVARRRQAAAQDRVRAMNARPFLYDPRKDRPHTSASIGAAFREAKSLALRQRAVPAAFEGMRLSDTRDTCVTRLFAADVPLDKIPPWTGHAADDRDAILRDHYLCLLEEGAVAQGDRLAAWALKNGYAG